MGYNSLHIPKRVRLRLHIRKPDFEGLIRDKNFLVPKLGVLWTGKDLSDISGYLTKTWMPLNPVILG